MMRSPILVATDLWARSDRAVDRAFVLGEQLGRMVCVVHASKRGSKAQLSAEVLEAKVREVLPDPQAETKIFLPLGSPLQAIVDTAEMCDAELVVTAVARFNSFGDYMVGTAVDQIIRDGHRPGLVVKQRPHQPYRKLLVTTDFSDTSRRGLLVAASLFPQAEIHVLMAYHVAYEGLQKDAHLRAEAHQRREKEMAAFLADPEVAEALGDVDELDLRHQPGPPLSVRPLVRSKSRTASPWGTMPSRSPTATG